MTQSWQRDNVSFGRDEAETKTEGIERRSENMGNQDNLYSSGKGLSSEQRAVDEYFNRLSLIEREALGRAEMRIQLASWIAVGVFAFLVGIFFIWMAIPYRNEWEVINIIFLVIGIALILGGAAMGICLPLYYKRQGYDAMAKKRIKRMLFGDPFNPFASSMGGSVKVRIVSDQKKVKAPHGEMKDTDRKIRSEFYKEWDELKTAGVRPKTFENGWRFRDSFPADVLVDEKSGKLAVCSFFETRICGVYEMSKIIGCELHVDGKVAMQSAVDSLQSYGDEFDLSSGALVEEESADANGAKAAKKEFKVVALYDDLSEIDLSFEFDDQKDLAERLYRMFSLIVRRNGRADGIAASGSPAE